MENITFEEGLALAAEWSLEYEYMMCINNGLTPLEACLEWDIL